VVQNRCLPYEGLRKVLGEPQPVARLGKPLMQLRALQRFKTQDALASPLAWDAPPQAFYRHRTGLWSLRLERSGQIETKPEILS